MRRLLVLLVPFLMVLSACTPEQIESFVAINESRVAHGLPMLQVSEEAVAKAQDWAERLAACQCLVHSGTGMDWSRWAMVGENVGYGHSIASIHEAFLASPTHKANMLGPWTHAGTGVAMNGDRLYVVQVFALAG